MPLCFYYPWLEFFVPSSCIFTPHPIPSSPSSFNWGIPYWLHPAARWRRYSKGVKRRSEEKRCIHSLRSILVSLKQVMWPLYPAQLLRWRSSLDREREREKEERHVMIWIFLNQKSGVRSGLEEENVWVFSSFIQRKTEQKFFYETTAHISRMTVIKRVLDNYLYNWTVIRRF